MDFFSPKGNFAGYMYLPEEMKVHSKLILASTLKQTNLKIKNDVTKYRKSYLQSVNKFLTTSYIGNTSSFATLFGFELFECYINSINTDLASDTYKPVLSNYKHITKLLDELTEVFFVENVKYEGLELIWVLFRESMLEHLDAFNRQQQDGSLFFSRTKLESISKRYVPYNWGWFEFQLKHFVDSFIKTLGKCLSHTSTLVNSSSELLTIHEFTKKILSQVDNADKGVKDSKGFSILGDYLDTNTAFLAKISSVFSNHSKRKFQFSSNPITYHYTDYSANQKHQVNVSLDDNHYEYIQSKVITNSFTDKHFQDNKSITDKTQNIVLEHILEEQTNLSEHIDLTPFFSCKELDETNIVIQKQKSPSDFIDYFRGSSRSEKEQNFRIITRLLLESNFLITRNNSFYWADLCPKFKGIKIAAFILLLRKNSWIDFNNDNPKIVIQKFIECFGIASTKGISERNFRSTRLETIKFYFRYFDFIPAFHENINSETNRSQCSLSDKLYSNI